MTDKTVMVPVGWNIEPMEIGGDYIRVDSPNDHHCIITKLPGAPEHDYMNMFHSFCKAMLKAAPKQGEPVRLHPEAVTMKGDLVTIGADESSGFREFTGPLGHPVGEFAYPIYRHESLQPPQQAKAEWLPYPKYKPEDASVNPFCLCLVEGKHPVVGSYADNYDHFVYMGGSVSGNVTHFIQIPQPTEKPE